MRSTSLIVLAACGALASIPASAADADLNALREEIAQMKQAYEQRIKALESRLEKAETTVVKAEASATQAQASALSAASVRVMRSVLRARTAHATAPIRIVARMPGVQRTRLRASTNGVVCQGNAT